MFLMMLLGEERVVDRAMEAQFLRTLGETVLTTPRNRDVAREAFEKDTWREMFCVASQLFGGSDGVAWAKWNRFQCRPIETRYKNVHNEKRESWLESCD
jgi:hypothetical protein